MALEAGLDRFLAWREVRDITGLGRTTAWRMRQSGDFPKPVPISPGRVAWRERDIVAWNESRGSTIPQPPPVAARAPVRRQEGRSFPALATSRSPAKEMSTATARPKASGGRRKPSIAEGQLGFDF
ncbi:AlpA family phage regulatory protein [Brevundimonas sp. S1H14]|uniref:helix-turn-helix transcriptional regulator n=1 Tax=Brevundimonas sp. S1H14 TaxID=3078084 RepID=UPI0039ECBB86